MQTWRVFATLPPPVYGVMAHEIGQFVLSVNPALSIMVHDSRMFG